MRKYVIYFPAAFVILLIIGLLSWLFTLHGTLAMVETDGLVRAVFIFIGAIGLLLLGLAAWRLYLTLKAKNRSARWLTAPVIILIVIGLVIPVAGFGYATSFPPSSIGDLPPHQILSDGVPLDLKDSQTLVPELHFAAASDAHFGAGTNSPDETAKMIQYIADPTNKFDCFFSVGDLVEMGSSNRQWREAFLALDPITSRMPIGFVPGNHDTLFTGLGNYTAYCSPGNPRLYYRTDIGKIHLLVLDIEWSAETYTAEQALWLEEQLNSIPIDEWKIILSHGYYYSSGFNYHGRLWADNQDTIQKLTPLFEKYKVGLVFTGHDHQLEFLQHNGVSYVTCGGFGGILDPEREYTSPASLWYLSGQFGFADVSINGDEAAVTFRSPDSKDLKSFTVKKP